MLLINGGRKFLLLVLVIALCLCAPYVGLHLRSLPPNPSALAMQQQEKQREESSLYTAVCNTTWELDDHTEIEVSVFILKATKQPAVSSYSSSRLKVMDRTQNKVIYERNEGDSFISMFLRDLDGDGSNEVVLNWARGSAGRIEVLSVNDKGVRSILDETYRVDAALVDLSGQGKIDILITTGESGVGPFYTTRYVWRGKQFQPAGRVPYKRLVGLVKGLFLKQ